MRLCLPNAVRRGALLSLVFALFAIALAAQTTVYVGPAGGDWHNAANWNAGLPAPGNNALITGGGNVRIGAPLTVNFQIDNFGTIAVAAAVANAGGNISNLGSMSIAAGGSLAGAGALTNQFGATLHVEAGASLTMEGAPANAGTLTNAGALAIKANLINSGTMTNAVGGALTVFAGAQLHIPGTLTNAGALTNSGAIVIGNLFANEGTTQNFGQISNNNRLENRAGATFSNRAGAAFDGNFGTVLLNLGTFENLGALGTFGQIQNDGALTNAGTLSANSGSTLTNNGNLNNAGTLNVANAVLNAGTWANGGTLNIGSGSVFSSTGALNVAVGGRVNNLFELHIKPSGALTNNGTVSNTIRLFVEGNFTNNAYLENAGDITIKTGGTLTNREVFAQIGGNTLNDGGTLRNEKRLLSDECSSIHNRATLNNTGGSLTLKGILFQRGTLTGNAVTNLGGYVHTGATSAAPSVCQPYAASLDANGDAKAYAQSLVAFETFDSCFNMVYRANGIARPVFHCSEVNAPQNVSLSIRTRMGDSLTCVAAVTPKDLLPPAFMFCPPSRVIFTQNASISNTWTVPTAADNCTAAPTLTSTHTSGATFPVGITGVTYTAKDAQGNTQNCQFKVEVIKSPGASNCTGDSIPPTLVNCPANMTINTNQPSGANAAWQPPTISDGCYRLMLRANHEPGETFPIGTTSIVYTANDGNNNISTCQFTLKVVQNDLCASDAQKPVFATCPANIFLASNAEIGGAVALWEMPQVADNCVLQSLVSTAQPGTVFLNGSTTVTYTATDAAGNSSACSFSVHVSATDPCPGDATAPTWGGCPANISKTTSGTSATATWTAPTATDVCSPIAIFASHQPGASFPLGATTVVYQASDRKGNARICSFTVSVANLCDADATAPVFQNCPANISTEIVGTSAPMTWAVPTATDACGGVSLSASYQPGAVFPLGTTTVIYTAKDARNNASTCSFTVKVVQNLCLADATPPVISNCPADILKIVTTSTTSVSWTAPTATDNCGTPTLTSTRQPGSVFSVGTTTVVYTAKDAKNNTSTCSFKVEVRNLSCTGKRILMVMGGSVPGSDEALLKAYLESKGYVVSAKDDDLATAADASAVDVVYISSTVSSSAINTKFRDVARPVINCEDDIMDDMKMTDSNKGNYSSTANLNIQRNNHPITSALPLGAVPVFYSPETVVWGKPSAGATVLATLPSSASSAAIFAYEKGATMVGMSAPARRVGFFLYNNSEEALLNFNSRRLIEQAFAWALDCSVTIPPPPSSCAKSVLFVSGNSPTSLPDDEIACIDRLQMHGMSVAVVEDNYVTTADASGKQLVVVTSSVAESYVSTKFRDVAVPVVIWKEALWDEMRMISSSSNKGEYVGSQVQIAVPSHQLAAGLSGSPAGTVIAEEYEWLTPAGAPVKAVVVPGQSSKVLVAGWETGAAMSSMNAPARRVALFFDEDLIPDLTAEGWKLFDASVRWATGCGNSLAAFEIRELTFAARRDGQTAQLAWISQMDVAYFVVERSPDGQRWQPIQKIDALGATAEERLNFDATDDAPLPGDNWYRLKIVAPDGSEQHSEASLVQFPMQNATLVFPNPARQTVWLRVPETMAATGCQAQFFNANGLISKALDIAPDAAEPLEISLDGLTNGVYLLRLSAPGQRERMEKIVVLRED